jgi:hypothetical protein
MSMFNVPSLSEPLTQGDLFDDCPLVGLRSEPTQTDIAAIPVHRWYSRVIALTQACDLAQPKTDLVLVVPMHTAERLVGQGVLKGNVIRDQLRRHLVFGWYYLPETTPPVALPESIIDLRDLHSVPRVVLEQLITGGKRIASLSSPYREHLAQHLAVTYMRVALPEPYPTRP